jgi:hypothetical protein
MHIIFFIVAGLIFACWLFGMSQPRYNRPMIFWKPTGIYGVLIAIFVFAIVGYLLSR